MKIHPIAATSPGLTRRGVLAGAAALAAAVRGRPAGAAQVLRIGLLNDQSGPYVDDGGPGSVVCARQAIAEFAADAGLAVDLLVADHQNKPDEGVGIARRWIDQGVDVVMDIQGSAIALALAGLMHERDKVLLVCNAGVVDLTGKACTPNTVHLSYDNYMLAHAIGTALVQAGGDTWFFITADYAFGHSMQTETSRFVTAAGGRILGAVALPFPSTDFSSALIQAQASGAKVIGLANAGTDMEACIKQAAEFGVTQGGVRLAPMLMQITRVHSVGLASAQNCVVANVFYWDANERTRAFTGRILPRMPHGHHPNMSQASCYSAVLHYLKAVREIGVPAAKASGAAVVAQMKAMPLQDDVYGHASIREDGRLICPATLYRVKRPAESRAPWDYYDRIATIPAEQAWRPLAEGGCRLVRS